MKISAHQHLFAIALGLAAGNTVASAQTADPLSRLRTASDLTTFDKPGAQPWHLRLEITLAPGSSAAGTGTIEEWWNDPTHFRVSFDLPTYKATVAQKGQESYRTPGTGATPFLARFVLDQMVHPVSLPSNPGAHPEVTKRLVGKSTLECIRFPLPADRAFEPRANYPTFCFVPDKPDLALTIEASQYAGRMRTGTFRGKQIPVDLVVGHEGTLGATVHLALLVGEADPYKEAADTGGLETEPAVASLVTEGVVPGKLITSFMPVYPPILKEQHWTGEVLLDVVVGIDGHVQSAAPVYHAHPLFVTAAIEAVKQWVYSPATLNGVPIALQTTITVNFRQR